MSSTTVRPTSLPSIKNAPLVGLAEGNSQFSNYHLAALVIIVPYFVKSFLPLVSRGGFKTYLFVLLLTGVPTTVAYWTLMSHYGARKNDKVVLPGKNIEEYITIKDVELKKLYHTKNKIPMQVFHDAYFEGKIDFNGALYLIIFRSLNDVSKVMYWKLWSSAMTGPNSRSRRSCSNTCLWTSSRSLLSTRKARTKSRSGAIMTGEMTFTNGG
jgi:hypothetical protein